MNTGNLHFVEGSRLGRGGQSAMANRQAWRECRQRMRVAAIEFRRVVQREGKSDLSEGLLDLAIFWRDFSMGGAW